MRAPVGPPPTGAIPSLSLNSDSDAPKTSSRRCARTASVHTHARSNLGMLPKGSLLSPPAIITKAYGPLRRTYCSRFLGSVRGKEHNASNRAMKPRSGSASRAPISCVTWSSWVKWCRAWGARSRRAGTWTPGRSRARSPTETNPLRVGCSSLLIAPPRLPVNPAVCRGRRRTSAQGSAAPGRSPARQLYGTRRPLRHHSAARRDRRRT